MTRAVRDSENEIVVNGDRRLWLFVLPIAAWGLHFLIVYVSAAIYCAKTTAAETLDVVRWAILVTTVAALAVVAAIARHAHTRYRAAGQTENGRRREDRFIGSTVLMLCALSAFATFAVAAAGLFFGDCRQ